MCPQVSYASVIAGLVPVAVLLVAALLLALDSTAAIIDGLNHRFVIGPQHELFGSGGGGGRGAVASAAATVASVIRAVTFGAPEVRGARWALARAARSS